MECGQTFLLLTNAQFYGINSTSVVSINRYIRDLTIFAERLRLCHNIFRHDRFLK